MSRALGVLKDFGSSGAWAQPLITAPAAFASATGYSVCAAAAAAAAAAVAAIVAAAGEARNMQEQYRSVKNISATLYAGRQKHSTCQHEQHRTSAATTCSSSSGGGGGSSTPSLDILNPPQPEPES